MASKAEAFRNDPRNQQACRQILDRIGAKHLGGQHVVYATQYGRPDNRLQGTSAIRVAQFAFDHAVKAASKALSTGLPTDGWIVITHEGIAVFSTSPFGDRIGKYKGTIPHNLVASISVDHSKKPGKTILDVTFIDHSEVRMFTKTKATYPAMSDWTHGIVLGAEKDESPASGPADADGAPLFDTNAFYDQNPALKHH